MSFLKPTHPTKESIKFRSMRLAWTIIAIELIVFLLPFAYVSLARGEVSWNLLILCFWSIFSVFGILFVNLTGEAATEPGNPTPTTQLLQTNLVCLIGLVVFLPLFYICFN